MATIYYPTPSNPYRFTRKPIILRTACTAGVNRSATIREFVKCHIHKNSIVYAPYGALYGDYEKTIISVNSCRDGFYDLFGYDKTRSIQSQIFLQLGYTLYDNMELQYLEIRDYKSYRNIINDQYWTFDNTLKNVFILVNENQDVINSVIIKLKNEIVDIVVLQIHDTIHRPQSANILPQSRDAYSAFIEAISVYFKFY